MRLLFTGLVFATVVIFVIVPRSITKQGLEQGGDFFPFDDNSSELLESLTPEESSFSMRYMGGEWVIKIAEENRRELKEFLDWDRKHQTGKKKNKEPQGQQPPRRRKPPQLLMEWIFQA